MTLFHGLSFADYVAFDREHFSRLRLLDISPLAYHRETKKKDTNALRIGRAVHAFVMDPNAVEIIAYDGRRQGKKWEDFEAEHEGAIILSPDAYERAMAMRDAVHAHPAASKLLNAGEGEESLFFEVAGVQCKARIDWIAKDGTVVELKTTRAIIPGRFAHEYARRLYHAQIALYRMGLEAERYGRPPVVTIALENAPPYDVAVYRVGEDVLEVGKRKVLTWLDTLARCRESGQWPGVGGHSIDGMLDLQLPDWAITDGLPDIELEDEHGD
ncbi:MAG: PD-(D/E)XK nuclease-like domain-containing protein [Polyangiaceae bacterium]|nr:PD-(D/E)XK nuclease-like domain-containing protein [Polyangiaceae bacterium]